MRAFAAFVVGILLPLPGFVGSFGRDVGAAATRMFDLGWVLSFVVGGIAYLVIFAAWNVPGHDEDRHLAFETKAVDIDSTMHGTVVVDGTEGTTPPMPGENNRDHGKESSTKEGMKLCV